MAQIINLNRTTPPPPANAVNGKWQKGATIGIDPSTGLPIYPASVYFEAATISSLGLVFPDNVGIGIDATGKLSLLGNPVAFKGAFSASTLYNVGDIVSYLGQAWICISQIDESITPGLVQMAATQGNSLAFTSNVTAGNLLIVLAGSSNDPIAPTDTLGTVYTRVETNGGPGLFGNFGSLYWGVAPSSGANTVTCSAMSGIPAIAIAEFRGVTSVVDAHSSNINVASLSLTTTQPTMIIIGRVEHHSTADTYTGTGGVTIAIQISSTGGSDRSLALGYVAESAAGAYTPGLSGTALSNPVTLAAAFLSNGLPPDVDTAHWLSLGAPPDGVVIGFGCVSGSTGTTVTPPGRLVSPRAATISKVKLMVNASDGATDLTFDIKKNGASIFSAPQTVTHGATPGTLSTLSLSSSTLSVAADDVFTIDVTAGTSSWNFTAVVE